MGKLFGTDGIRGVVNDGLDAMLAYKVGMAAAHVMTQEKGGGQPRFAIGKDTRISSDLLEGALIAGLCSAGADVLHLGVIPTPAVAWVTVDTGCDAGVVISASHNPFEHNGIKIFNGRGFKLSDELENRIEDIILNDVAVPLKTGGDIGRVIYADQQESQDYIDHLVSTISSDLAGLHILVDCANGAASATAARLFDRFPDLHTDVIHADPDGVNINNGCGSTHLEQLKAMVKAGGYDLGIAFDGDADRCLMVDETGEEIDGDQVIAACGLDLKEKGELSGGAIVATVMSNLGLHRFCQEHGVALFCTSVGDRNVLEKMEESGYVIGGEQSGHIIFREFMTTGDGQLTAVQLLRAIKKSGKKLSELAQLMQVYPQVILNVRADKEMKRMVKVDEGVLKRQQQLEEGMNGNGRILVRPSGTEPVIRIMVEGLDREAIMNAAKSMEQIIIERLGYNEDCKGLERI